MPASGAQQGEIKFVLYCIPAFNVYIYNHMNSPYSEPITPVQT